MTQRNQRNKEGKDDLVDRYLRGSTLQEKRKQNTARGRGAGRVAYEQGEVNVDYQTTPAYLKSVRPMVKSGKAVMLFSWLGS